MKHLSKILIPLLALSSAAFCAEPDASKNLVPRATEIFTAYESRERSFDPSVADLYCDTALIRITRKYPDGQIRVMELPAPRYKELIRQLMSLAKKRGDLNKYSDVHYSQDGESVRITASRYSVLKDYTTPISILVGPCTGGDLAIIEEISE